MSHKIKRGFKKVYLGFLILVLSINFGFIVFATGWDTTQPFHEPLFTDTIKGKSGDLITVKENFNVEGKVGIGTTVHDAKLTIDGKSITGLQIYTDNQGPWGLRIHNRNSATRGLEIFEYDNGGVSIWNNYNSGTLLHLKSTGEVGIGTTGPNNQLTIGGSQGTLNLGANGWITPGDSGGSIVTDDSTYKALMIVGNNVPGNSGKGREVKVWDYLNVQGDLNTVGKLCIAGDCKSAWPSVPSETDPVVATRLNTWSLGQTFSGGANFPGSGIWNTAGNVGIGTTEPLQKLEVNSGNIIQNVVSGWRDGYILKRGNSGYTIGMASNGADLQFGNVVGSLSDLAVKMTITNAGNVGIGTTNPGAKLHVVGRTNIGLTGTSGQYALSFSPDISGNTIFHIVSGGSGNTNTFRIVGGADPYSGQAEYVTILNSGNVGIGTTSPGQKLQVEGNIQGHRIKFPGVGGDSGVSPDYYSIYQESGPWDPPFPDLRIQYHTGIKYDAYSGYGGHQFFTGFDGSGNPTGLQMQITDKVYIAGNVGIGTTGPGAGLDIETGTPQLNLGKTGQAGQMLFARSSDGSLAGFIGFRDAAESSNFDVFSQGGGAYLNLGGQSYILFRTGDVLASATERMRITNTGNVGIGTTSPAAKLHLAGGSGSDLTIDALGKLIINNGAGGNNYVVASSNVGTPTMDFYAGATKKLVLGYGGGASSYFNDGNVGIGTASPGGKLTVQTPNNYDGVTLKLESKAEPTAYNLYTQNTVTNGVVRWGLSMVNAGTTYSNMLVFDRGNVGIGTTSPGQKLQVEGNIQGHRIKFPGVGGDSGVSPDYYSIYQESGPWDPPFPDLRIQYHTGIKYDAYGGYGGHQFFTGYDTTGNPAGLQMQITDKVYIAGNVGIGTTGTNNQLTIGGSQGTLNLGANGWITPGDSGGSIITDDSTYKALMIVGNNVPGNSGKGREVKVWDYLNVQGDLNTVGKLCIAGDCKSAWPSVPPETDPVVATRVNTWSLGQTFSGGANFPGSGIWNTAGNVGIGTTEPSQKLEITGRVTIAPSGTGVDNAYNGNLVITKPVASGQYINLIRSGNYPWSIGTVYNSNNFAIGTGVVSDSSFTNPEFVIGSGKVGIGTTEPGYKLDVAGTAGLGQTYLKNSDIYFTDTSHSHTGIGNTAGYAAIENAANYDALMILGRAGTSKGRYVRLWDYLQVNGGMDITGNVGIGTTSPGEKLEINGNLKFTGANPYISASSYFIAPGGAYFNSGTVYTEATIQARGGIANDGTSTNGLLAVNDGLYVSGNVGIGTADPKDKLHIKTSGYNNGLIIEASSSDSPAIILKQNNAIADASILFYEGSTLSSQLIFHNGGGFEFLNRNPNQQSRFFIDTSGKVGIGTTNPISTLSVNGDGIAGAGVYGSGTATGVFGSGPTGVSGSSASTNGIGVSGSSASTNGIGVSGSGGSTGVSGSGPTGVYGYGTGTGSTTGVFGYGSTGVFGSGFNFGVYGSSFSTGVYGTGSTTGVFGYGSTGVYGTGSTTGVYGTGSTTGVYGSGPTGVYGYGTNFDFYAAGPGPDYGTSSSIRWKNNIQPINNALDKVMSLRGVYFDWDKDHGGEHGMGMIAEEVGKIVPEIVSYESNGKDASGMDYGHLTPILVEAVKEQQQQIKEQQKQIEELKAENKKLKASQADYEVRLKKFEELFNK